MYSRIKKSVHIKLHNCKMSGSEETFEDVSDNLQSIFDLSYEGRRTSYASELSILSDQPNRERDLEYKRKVLG